MTGAKPAASKLAALFGSADVAKVIPKIRRLSNGAMLTVVLGQTFHGRLAAAPIDQTPDRKPRTSSRARAPPSTSSDATAARSTSR